MKKILSLALAIIMCITSLSFATSVFAADSSNCATVLLDGIENNSLIDDTANAINECRTASGKTAIQLDNTLCEQAKQRAKDVFVFLLFLCIVQLKVVGLLQLESIFLQTL